ncbi:MAG: hypothetical protein UW30_C0007G0002 [Candidatus Giovannonibacteria bacterium GW2011_GWA2_44_13b]|uniref:Nudix hydrolase domain-containing protein n=2 Tax=Candidatus Giovannoniibacteriota TaxID=1752738 RepID=A0A0G1H3Y1_9BACT|nr:MAG: hypothetical protein UW30_C0007G0002 [Candidatus Giovannonibacteria bacterium GW2011_GWA2_44_13b]OGF82601.1 MAG: hypothetical protein A2924_00995 [Candidatus Giovannonibacteria bacterium RIFCSPLOWO2_01_FULL_44_16]
MSEHWSGGIYTKPQDEKTHILLTRTSLTAEWSLPGGKQSDENESPMATFVREIYEEISCVAWAGLLILKVSEPEHLRYVFELEPQTEIKESDTIQFFPLIRLPENLRERHKQILCCLYKDLIRNERKLLRAKLQPLSLAA